MIELQGFAEKLSKSILRGTSYLVLRCRCDMSLISKRLFGGSFGVQTKPNNFHVQNSRASRKLFDNCDALVRTVIVQYYYCTRHAAYTMILIKCEDNANGTGSSSFFSLAFNI